MIFFFLLLLFLFYWMKEEINTVLQLKLLQIFSLQPKLMVFHWSLMVRKSPQVSWTFLSILTDLNNAVVWMVSARPLIFNSSSLLNKPLGIVPSAPVTIGITDNFMFHSLLSLLLLLFQSLKALADSLSLESERQQVSSSLRDSSQYSGRPQ